jgi:hypothetical protein
MSRGRDGYDLLVCTYFDAVNTLLYKSLHYKLEDLVGITLIARYSYVVAAANSLPVDTFPALIAYTRQHPGEVTTASRRLSTQNLIAKRLRSSPACKKMTILAIDRGDAGDLPGATTSISDRRSGSSRSIRRSSSRCWRSPATSGWRRSRRCRP